MTTDRIHPHKVPKHFVGNDRFLLSASLVPGEILQAILTAEYSQPTHKTESLSGTTWTSLRLQNLL